jgi:hypothetical protein
MVAFDGWLGDRMWQIVDVIGTILDANRVRGMPSWISVIDMVLICPADAVAPLANRLAYWTCNPRYC